MSAKDYINVGYLIGDGNLLLTIRGNWNSYISHPDNEGTIDLTEFKGYSKLTLKINGSQVQEKWPDIQNVIITATKHGISKDDKKIAKKIVLNGDSLCNQLGIQLMRICHAFDYDMLNRTRGGEKIIGNLTRTIGIMCRIAQQFTMIDSEIVNIKMTTSWVKRNGEYA